LRSSSGFPVTVTSRMRSGASLGNRRRRCAGNKQDSGSQVSGSRVVCLRW
jgi:hypothetical protein